MMDNPNPHLGQLFTLPPSTFHQTPESITMSDSARETIQAEYESALSGLVECYANEIPQIIREPLDDVEDMTAAVVGFGDLEFSGSAILLATVPNAKALSESAPLNPTDWLGELGNQVVGRLKNKLAAYGVLPQLGSPVTIRGKHLDFSSVGGKTETWLVRWSGGELRSMLSLHVKDHFVLSLDPSTVPAEEGSLSMF
jgi:hypothetical protein